MLDIVTFLLLADFDWLNRAKIAFMRHLENMLEIAVSKILF